MSPVYHFFATSPKGLELLLVDELRALGASHAAEKLAGVSFQGTLDLAYKACLWSRLANRILLPLAHFEAATPEALYDGVQTIDWDSHLSPQSTLSVEVVCSKSIINHSLYAAQKVKDAIVDQFRLKHGVRPSVAREKPDVQINVYLHHEKATVSIDLSGQSLHKRGYRIAGGSAPLKENLAAALLIRAGWPKIAAEGGALYDPMCGSGTLLIEAAMMASNMAPGLFRSYFGFLGWKKHDPDLWTALCNEAKTLREKAPKLPSIVGFDHDKYVIKMAFDNIEHAGFLGQIHVEKRSITSFASKSTVSQGLIITNPPYGERVGELSELQSLYPLLGEKLKANFLNWQAAIFTGNPELSKQMGLRAKRYYSLFNGALPAKLLLFDIVPTYFVDRSERAENARRIQQASRSESPESDESIIMFSNRLRKKLKHLKRVMLKKGVNAYRVYDKDLPDYAFAIDLTENAAYVKEYKAPKFINETKILQRRNAVLSVLPRLLDLSPEQIYFSDNVGDATN